MPELPEVETIARNLRLGNEVPALPGRRIERATLHWPRHVETPSVRAFQRRIRGRTIQDVGRRGKYLVLPLDRYTLLIHLRMSGDLLLEPSDSPNSPYDHTVFHLDNGWELRFRDSRKFGRVYLVEDPESILGKLGPEPLSPEFTADTFQDILGGRKRILKTLLLDQSILAGIGNIYADEALYIARLHPTRRSDSLTSEEIHELWVGIRDALQRGLVHNGASIDWVYRGGEFQNHFQVYQRAGEACPVCGTTIERIVVGQRGTHFCPTCQQEA